MSFNDEKEMYDIIAAWLKKRDSFPCLETIVDKKDAGPYKFKFGGKMHKGDVIGVYETESSVRFVGVEAKLTSKEVQSATRQALPLHSFCHEVYIAVPERSFKELSGSEQGDLRAQLLRSYTGLLLVSPIGRDRVNLELPIEPIPFRLAIHKNAEWYFRWYFDPEVLLDVFRTRVGKKGLNWLRENWYVDEDNESWIWTHEERGKVFLKERKIEVVVNVDSKELVKRAVAEEIHFDLISDLVVNLSSLERDEKTINTPMITIDTDVVLMDLDAIDDENIVGLCSLIKAMGFPSVQLSVDLERPLVMVPKTNETDFIDDIRFAYDNLLMIAEQLESFSDAW